MSGQTEVTRIVSGIVAGGGGGGGYPLLSSREDQHTAPYQSQGTGCVTNRKHCVTDYFLYHCVTDYFLYHFLYYVIVCTCLLPSSLVYCISTYLLKRQSAGKGEALHLGAQSGILRPLAEANASAKGVALQMVF